MSKEAENGNEEKKLLTDIVCITFAQANAPKMKPMRAIRHTVGHAKHDSPIFTLRTIHHRSPIIRSLAHTILFLHFGFPLPSLSRLGFHYPLRLRVLLLCIRGLGLLDHSGTTSAFRRLRFGLLFR